MSMSYPTANRYATPEVFVGRATPAAALPHLVDDKAVKRAARALWAEGHCTPSPPHPDMAYWERIARRALEAALGAPVKAGAVDDDAHEGD